MSKDKPGIAPSTSHEAYAEEGAKPIFRPDSDSMGPIERANLVAHLGLMSQRLANVEAQLKSKLTEGSGAGTALLEFFKILLGGWPAFGLLFMILFYTPIRDAINTIPEKVRSADEIAVMGVSLKNSIRIEAEKVGALQLSETLPALSPAAIEFLIRSREFNSLVSYTPDSGDANLLSAIWLPNEKVLSVLRELESKKLASIILSSSERDRTVGEFIQALDDWKKNNPVRDDGGSITSESVQYVLRAPTKERPPSFSWRLTNLGKNAVNIILKAVSSQFAPQRSMPETPKQRAEK